MSKPEQKRRLVGPWRNLHTAVWLIGLAIIAWHGWWWPGILVLVAISLVIEAVLMRVSPQSFEPVEDNPSPTQPIAESVDRPSPAPTPPEHRLDLLPDICPRCGGPILGHDVNWTGPQSANCPYCGINLPMQKA